MKYVPLYIKTDNSLQDSLITVKSLIDYAVNEGFNALSIADSTMYGVMDFYTLCKKNNIKPFVGLEVKYSNYKLVLYCMNYKGYQNLLKLATISSERELELSDLEKYSNDLVCLIPYAYVGVFGEIKSFYQHIYKTYTKKSEKQELGSGSLYMKETIYLTSDESKYVRFLDAMREGTTIEDISSDRIDNNLKRYKELESEGFLDLYEELYELCNLEIVFNQNLMPVFKNEKNVDSYAYLKKKCIEGLKNKFGSKISSKYQDRLKMELNVINQMGFCDYFLIVYDYIKYARDNDIIVGPGRGSVVGSLVAYVLNITDVDPLEYDLLFERFLNPERISMPDIDIDFEHTKREELIEYCRMKYGDKKVAPIITFGTMGAKQALRDVARAYNLELDIIDGLCKIVSSRLSLEDNYKNQKVKSYLKRYEYLEDVYKIARVFEGLKRHTSIHAAGVVMSNIDLDEIIPLDKSDHTFYTSGYDMQHLEDLGLLKMDFLAIKYLTIIHNIINEVNKTHKTKLTFDNIPFNDKKALKIFETSNTLGIFQFESEGMMNFLSQLKPDTFDEVIASIALFRPGPMQNIPTYIKRKHGKENVEYLDKSLEPILKSTYGIMIYQEQIMKIAEVMADYTLGEADILRKAMSKKIKELLLKEEKRFVEGAFKKGYEKELIKNVFKLMIKFAEYGFNKSHSVGYSLVSYRMAYLKAHYPTIFMSNLLSIDMNDSSKIKKYLYECRKNNIQILSPDINLSSYEYKMEELGIRCPLTNIKNVGMAAAKLILEEREKTKFLDIYDFVRRCYGKSVNTKTIESLIEAGAFSVFGWNRKTLINNLDSIINYGELTKDLDEEFTLKPEMVFEEEYSTSYIMERELELFGLYISKHPVTEIRDNYKNIVLVPDIPKYFDKIIDTIVYVDKIKEVDTKSNKKMAFLLGSDEIGTIDVTLFPNMYENLSDVAKGDVILVTGKVEKRFDKYQLVASKIEKIK